MSRMTTFPRRAARRHEAQVRQAEYDGLSTAEKIKRAVSRRGNSKKELGRLSIDSGMVKV